MSTNRSEFDGKSVVVTGAGAGMGKQITTDFLKNGATVVAVEIDEDKLNSFYEELKSSDDDDLVNRFIPFVGDISRTVLFLASDESKFINGASIVVDGGLSCG